jgi:dephospho-CoA kinase
MTSNKRKPVIGVLGGIGSGKSAVADRLARRGGRVINADRIGHQALEHPPIKEQIVARWGDGVLDENGAVARRQLGAIVFASATERKALEALVHPWIGERIRAEIEAAQNDPAVPFVVLDAAIMLEAGWSGVCDRLIFVDVSREKRLARLQASRNWSASELEAREQTQLPLKEKASRADHVLTNEGSLEELHRQVDAFLAESGFLSSPLSVSFPDSP